MVRHISSGSVFEAKFGYSRAVIAGLIENNMKIEIEVTARIGAAISR